jgi:hypothetical protein
MLTNADGPIAAFRRWAQQFYPERVAVTKLAANAG